MKKELFVILFLVFFISCGSDDESVGIEPEIIEEQDRIIGKWFLKEQFINGVDSQLTDCVQTSFVDYMEDGTAIVEVYDDNDVTNNCDLFSSENSTWEFIEGNTYILPRGSLDPATFEVDFLSEIRYRIFVPFDEGEIIQIFEKQI